MPTTLHLDSTTGVITIIPEDSTLPPVVITNVDIDNYRETLSSSSPLYCYKSTSYDPLEMSPAEGRYSRGGCLYTIASVSAAQAEVSDWAYRNLYSVDTSNPIYALNFSRLADDFGIRDLVTQHVSAGGWEPTQQFAEYFTSTIGISAIIVPSTKSSDDCVNFYADSRLPDGFLKLCSQAISSTTPAS